MADIEEGVVPSDAGWLALAFDRAIGPFSTRDLALLARDRALGKFRHQLTKDEGLRSLDQEGRLHVKLTPICRAAVNPYKGDEIPDWDKLGLDPDRIYQMLRPPEEIAKGAATSNNIQLMSDHVPVTADDPQRETVAGSLGTDAVWDEGTGLLLNSLVVWDAEDIKAIDDDTKRELSPSYSYDPDMTPGKWGDQAYDGRMTNIRFNHVALVEQGRQGPVISVADAAPRGQPLFPGSIWDRITQPAPGLLDLTRF